MWVYQRGKVIQHLGSRIPGASSHIRAPDPGQLFMWNQPASVRSKRAH